MEQKTHYLYVITRDDGCKYIGVSIDPNSRLQQHIQGNGSIHLVGRKNLSLEVICEGRKEYIYNLERAYIKENRPELNISEGGYGGDSGNAAKGEKNGQAKLLEKDIVDIREKIHYGVDCYSNLAKKYGVSKHTIYAVCIGKTWKHIGGPLTSFKGNKKELIKKVKELFNEGLSGREITEILPISLTSVYRYRNQ
jgi:predicted GIY-YIG superfamily endonuclease/transposase